MPGRPIQPLSTHLVNKIAAGEVIERPASVVKELVENALDAGATQVVLEIEDGGRELIRVTDDGDGMPADQLPLALAEHATSKLADEADLFAISTMGFRGEALASIAAISHLKITSRTPDDDAAWAIESRGGDVTGPAVCAGNRGTGVEVRNLFFNTPARRKFLKGGGTETQHVNEMFLRLALPRPQVSFRLINNGRTTHDLPATDPVTRLLAVWPREFAEQRLTVDATHEDMRLVGIVGLPELAHVTARYQHLFVNGRPIRDRFMNHALREAYRGLTEPGRQPAAVLLLTLPPADVDVNVHPTKSEVRFKDSGRVHSLVLSGVRQVLLGAELTPRAVPHVQAAATAATAEADEDRRQMRRQLADFFLAVEPTQGRLETPGPVAEASRQPANDATSIADGVHAAEGTGAAASAVPPAFDPAAGRALQLHDSYLVAQTEDGLEIIDQHALHERIMYEELWQRVQRGPLESQALLMPLTLPATPRQLELLEEVAPLLKKLGIEAEAFGPDTAAVRAFPSFLSRLDPVAFVAELLERGESEQLDLHAEELLHDVLDMMACKAAVKAGDRLDPAEVQALLARRHLISRSSNCPHGRPTTLKLSLKDLEKQFKRTGF
ncbi:MAG: DNA mismatch repair endonuclease MutL [Phycisphaerae bacterium]